MNRSAKGFEGFNLANIADDSPNFPNFLPAKLSCHTVYFSLLKCTYSHKKGVFITTKNILAALRVSVGHKRVVKISNICALNMRCALILIT